MATNDEIYALLNRAWTPHKGQQIVGQSVFNSPASMVYVQCGRKFGKSELACYCCWVYALTHPGAEVYYLAPLTKQAKELVWYNNRIQTCNTYGSWWIPAVEKLLGGPVKVLFHESRIVLPNGSFIKVDGSDNYDSQRGLKPDFIVADEYATFKSRWLPTVKPNMLVKQGKILFITTPPLTPNHSYDLALECELKHKAGNPKFFYLNLPTSCNDRLPHLQEELIEEKERLFAQGKQNEWYREYEAKFVANNEYAIIPQLNRETVVPYEKLVEEIKNCRSNWDFCSDPEIFVTLDPSNTTIFSALIGVSAIKQGKLYVLDTFCEGNTEKTAVKDFMEVLKLRLDKIKEDTGLSKVYFMHNSKTNWISNDLFELSGVVSDPSPKEYADPLYGISTIKDALQLNRLYVSDKCGNLVKSSELYIRDEETGQVPVKPVPDINCLRFLIAATGFTWEIEQVFDERSPSERFLDTLRVPQPGILKDIMEQEDYHTPFD